MSKERAKGTAWETAVLRWLKDAGYGDAYRTGSAEYGKGDIYIPSLKVAIECKNVARIDLADIVNQCRRIKERNSDLVAVIACIKKRGHTSPADAHWVGDGWNWLACIEGVRADS